MTFGSELVIAGAIRGTAARERLTTQAQPRAWLARPVHGGWKGGGGSTGRDSHARWLQRLVRLRFPVSSWAFGLHWIFCPIAFCSLGFGFEFGVSEFAWLILAGSSGGIKRIVLLAGLSGVLFRLVFLNKPNDPKLSDRGARRGTCAVGERRRPEAGAVTCGAVRCSAWLGVRRIVLDVVKGCR